jgi:hypothetical protein
MLLWIRRDLSTASTVYVLPDALEKHCIQAEPNVDKNGSASKKAAFAHVPLWICRRFSTVAAVFQGQVIQVVVRWQANASSQLSDFLAPVSAIPLSY